MKHQNELHKFAGIDVILVPIESPTTSVRLICGSGSISDTKPGAAHFLEHLFFKGTADMSAAEVNRDLARLGVSNAWTSHDSTCFSIDTLPSLVMDAVAMLCHLIEAPRLDEEDVDTERGPIHEELVGYQDSGFHVAYLDVVEMVTGLTPIIGSAESIKAMTREDLLAYCKLAYHRSNLALVIAGDLGGVNRGVLNSLLSSMKIPDARREEQKPFEILLGSWLAPESASRVHTTSQSVVIVATPIDGHVKDHKLGYPTALMQSALGGGMHSLLWQRLREERGLGYDVGCFSIDNLDGQTGVSLSYALVSEDDVQEATHEIRRTIEMAPDLIDEELLKTAEMNWRFTTAKNSQTPGGMAGGFFTHWHKSADLRGYEGFLEDMAIGQGEKLQTVRDKAAQMLDGCWVYTLNPPS